MNSDKPASDCFVYIWLPGQTQAVTAGRFELTQDRRGIALGRFMYGRSYLARNDAVAIDPVELKLSSGTYETIRLNGVFGALRDAGPDHWARRIIEKRCGKTNLGELDYLLGSPDDRTGALGFGLGQQSPAAWRDFNQTLALERLQKIAAALVRDELSATDAEAVQVQDLL
jgi:serine/threonine-protein kinase HipA